jgi:hypothetical protein
MASEQPNVVSQFDYDESYMGWGAADFQSSSKQIRDWHLASQAKSQLGATARLGAGDNPGPRWHSGI